MSRSYKKHSFSAICSSYGDKWCRNYYHKAERRKIKRILQEEVKAGIEKPIIWDEEMCTVCIDTRAFVDYDIPYKKYGVDFPHYNFDVCCCSCYGDDPRPAEKIINRIDYSLPYSDKWSWASDGGNYYHSDYSELRKEFDREVFSAYYEQINAYSRSKDYDIWSEYKKYVEKKSNAEHPTMILFLKRKISEEFCDKKTIEVPYNKEHKYDTSLTEGWEVYRICKERGYGWHGESSWEEIRYSMMPTNFITKEQFIDWLRENEERMIRTIYKLRYGK